MSRRGTARCRRGQALRLDRRTIGIWVQRWSHRFPPGGNLLWRAADDARGPGLNDRLQLEVHDFEVSVLTGIYSEETHLPQPLLISMTVDLDCPAHFGHDTPLSASKNYLDLKRAATLPEGVHFTLIEGVADHIAQTLLREDSRVQTVKVKIVKLAISEQGEAIGMTLVRHRR